MRDGQVALSVADTGCGLPGDVLDRLFEPFLPRGAGEGLGLGWRFRATSCAISAANWAENRPGGGARFTIVLPVEAGIERNDEHGSAREMSEARKDEVS